MIEELFRLRLEGGRLGLAEGLQDRLRRLGVGIDHPQQCARGGVRRAPVLFPALRQAQGGSYGESYGGVTVRSYELR